MRRVSNFQWLLILATCALIVFVVGAISLHLRLKGLEIISENFLELLPHLLFWAIHTPLILILSRRFSSERRHLVKNLLIFFSVGIVWIMFVQGLPALFIILLKGSTGYNSRGFYDLPYDWLWSVVPNMLIYWLILSANFIFLYYEQYQKELLKASQLDAQLSNARLQTLKMQLHPHFLFNTMHSISALVLKNENRDAVKMINRLSEFLRLTLDNIETQVLTLEDEIEFTRRYLEIELIRFHDRLAVEWKIDSKTLEAEVPTLILQPLVENAMRHAVDSNLGNSRIQIAAYLQNDQLLMEVCDNGKDIKKVSNQKDSSGLGLKNTRARLRELYGGDYNFSLSRKGDEWTIAQIAIPFLPVEKQSKGELK